MCMYFNLSKMTAVTCVLFLCSVLPMLSLAQLQQGQCTIPGEYQPEDPGFYVYPDLSCTDNGLTFQLVHNYTEDLIDSRIQLFYECTATFGEVSSDTVPSSTYTALDDYVYSVLLSSSILDPGFTCTVYGCYEPSSIDSNFDVFPIQNRTCQYTEMPTQETSTSVSTQGKSTSVQVSTQEVTTEGRVDSQCTLAGDYQPEDPGFYVYTDLSCTDNGLTFQLVHNYEQTRASRIQLFYECTTTSGEVSSDTVPHSYNTQLDDYVFSVPLSSPLVDHGSTCTVYGCYVPSLDLIYDFFPIQSRTCQYTDSPPPVAIPNSAGIIGSCRSLLVILAGIVLATVTL